MRLFLFMGVAALLAAGAAWGGPAPAGDFRTRLRANDAPVGGRFTINAYFLDSLDAAVELPAPGRLLVLQFTDANGDDSFLIPGDLFLQAERARWNRGFHPVGKTPLEGRIDKETSRWAVWFVPAAADTFLWRSVADLRLGYGIQDAPFAPLDPREAAEVRASLPLREIRAVNLDAERTTAETSRLPDPAAFDEPPVVKTKVDPAYPQFSRLYDFHGSLHVAVEVDPRGRVTDAYVLQSTAAHELNVAALVAAMDWIFRPGKKNNVWVQGEIVIPMTFSLGPSR